MTGSGGKCFFGSYMRPRIFDRLNMRSPVVSRIRAVFETSELASFPREVGVDGLAEHHFDAVRRWQAALATGLQKLAYDGDRKIGRRRRSSALRACGRRGRGGDVAARAGSGA